MAYLVPPSPVFAGVERVVHEIAAAIARNHRDAVDVHVIYSTFYDKQELADAPYVRHDLHVSQLRELPGRLRAVVRSVAPDVLVCAQVEPSVLAWFATRGLGVAQFIPHLHGNPIVEESRGSLRTRLAFRVFRHVLSRRMAAVFVVAPSMTQYVRTRLARRTPVHWVKNPVRPLTASATPETGDGPFRFVNVARHDVQKGLDILLDAWAIVARSLPSARLVLVGSGPDEESLRRQAGRLGISDSVVFAGFQPQPAEIMSDSDCFVLSSRWEGFPLVLLEALSLGLPVLAADCDFGPRDLVTDPALGTLVPVGDAKALGEAIVEVARRGRHPDRSAARRSAAAAYRPEAAADQHLAVLRRVVGSSAGA